MAIDYASRRGARVFVDIEVDCRDQDIFLFAYLHDRDATGVFVRTIEPEAPGTNVNLRFVPRAPGGLPGIDGEVIWINPYRPHDSNNLSPGMGVLLCGLTGEQRHELIFLIKRLAYLDETSYPRESVSLSPSLSGGSPDSSTGSPGIR